RDRIDVNAFHRREIDHEPAVARGPAGDVVAAAADGDFEVQRPRELDGIDDVGDAEAARYEHRPFVDEPVVYAAGLVVARVERLRRRIDAPRGDYERTLRAVTDLVHEIERETGERGTVGVGIPGIISNATGLVKNANSTWLIGRPLGDDLPALLDRPVRFAND